MKLLTHNFLTSNIIKGVKNGFPLSIVPRKVNEITVDFNAEFIERIAPRLEWGALVAASSSIKSSLSSEFSNITLPQERPDNWLENEELLKAIHHLVMEVDIVEGDLVCPETGRIFPISNGIPNMLLNENEVD